MPTPVKSAQEIASRYNILAYADYNDLLPHVDAASIAAPTRLHYEIGLA
jgi:virulence factor